MSKPNKVACELTDAEKRDLTQLVEDGEPFLGACCFGYVNHTRYGRNPPASFSALTASFRENRDE